MGQRCIIAHAAANQAPHLGVCGRIGVNGMISGETALDFAHRALPQRLFAIPLPCFAIFAIDDGVGQVQLFGPMGECVGGRDQVRLLQLAVDKLYGRQVVYDSEAALQPQRLPAQLIVEYQLGQAEDQDKIEHAGA